MENNLDQYKIAELIFLELKNELSETEKDILDTWKSENPQNLELYNKIIHEDNIVNKINSLNKIDKKKAWNRLDRVLEQKQKTKGIQIKSILKYAAAACIILIIGSYLIFRKPSPGKNEKLVSNTVNTVIPSGTQKATLTTSTNEIIELGKTGEKRNFQLANVSAMDTNNTLIFQQTTAEQPDKVPVNTMNTLETPRGGEYSLVLSDGTRVFLNAETRLTFPEIFTTDSREVILDGEAYFEVTKSETKSFIVKTPDYDIEVYGTSFNVSAYSSDLHSHTTLVTGSVGININTGTEVKLIPGEQAYFDKTNNSLKKKQVDTYLYTSWKEGKFMFDNETLEEIMRKLERWYNIETEYLNEEIMRFHFSGTLDRYDEISDILNLIALTTRIEFNIKGNVIYINKKED